MKWKDEEVWNWVNEMDYEVEKSRSILHFEAYIEIFLKIAR